HCPTPTRRHAQLAILLLLNGLLALLILPQLVSMAVERLRVQQVKTLGLVTLQQVIALAISQQRVIAALALIILTVHVMLTVTVQAPVVLVALMAAVWSMFLCCLIQLFKVLIYLRLLNILSNL
ncbi:hypothetical protein DU977_12405, partial [Vibrio cholerae]|nr:hypothetical protein [Vibrio cholerae]